MYQPGSQGRSILVEIDKNEAFPDFDLEIGKPVRFPVKLAGLVHGRGANQVTIQRVTPMVVRTQEPFGIAAAFSDQHGPVLTNGRHRLQLALAVSRYDDGLIYRGRCEIVPGL